MGLTSSNVVGSPPDVLKAGILCVLEPSFFEIGRKRKDLLTVFPVQHEVVV